MSRDPWEMQVRSIARSWLVDECAELPELMLVPLENPHLFDCSPWAENFGTPVSSHGVVNAHERGGSTFCIAKPVMGASAVTMLVEVASDLGVSKVIGVGYCGGIRHSLAAGDVVSVESSAGRLEAGAGYDLLPVEHACPSIADVLAKKCSNKGALASVGSVHLETDALISDLGQENIAGLDLESYALLGVSRIRNVRAGVLAVVSDHASKGLATDGAAIQRGVAASLAAIKESLGDLLDAQ